MHRLTVVLLTLALAALSAGPAHAKGVSKLVACGANGCRDATPDRRNDEAVMEGGPEIGPPHQKAPFFELHVTLGVPDTPEGPPIQILYVPAVHAMRVWTPNQASVWMHPTDHSENALKHAIARLVPFDASKLDLSVKQPAIVARVDEVVPAPRPGDPPSSTTGWLAWGGGATAALLLIAGAWVLLRRRRAGPDPHPVA